MKPSHLVALLLLFCLALNGTASAVVAPDLHRPFATLLQRHVDRGVVDYAAFQVDVKALDSYLQTLADADLSGTDRATRLAFYINAYNACTIRLILRHFPNIASIRDIHKPWKTREWKLAGETLSLDDVEHKKLRRELAEPRIHFAIVCASISCPHLASHAYDSERIDAQLEQAADDFIQAPANVQVEMRKGIFGTRPMLHLSKIFDWFGGDFESTPQGSVVDFVAAHATAEVAAFIVAHRAELKVDHLPYDWDLNGKRAAQ